MLKVVIGNQINVYLENVGIVSFIEKDNGEWSMKIESESNLENLFITRPMKNEGGFFTEPIKNIWFK